MNDALPIIISLGVIQAGLLFGLWYQQSFYARVIKDLVDRLMARSLQEFEHAKNPPPPRIVVKNEPPLENFDRIL